MMVSAPRYRSVSHPTFPICYGSGYVARLFRKALRMLGIRHVRTRPLRPGPIARPSASPRPCSGNGPTPFRLNHPIDGLPTFPDGSPGTIITGPMPASPNERQFRLSPEQPDQKPKLGGSMAGYELSQATTIRIPTRAAPALATRTDAAATSLARRISGAMSGWI